MDGHHGDEEANILDSLIQDGLDFGTGGTEHLNDHLDLDNLDYNDFVHHTTGVNGQQAIESAFQENNDVGTPVGSVQIQKNQNGDLSGYNGSGVQIVEGSEVNSGTFGAETGSSGRPGRQGKRPRVQSGEKGEKKSNQHMKGRFSGRLPTKEDEKRLADECKKLGPYLCEDKTSLTSLATIIRGIAAGTVRAHIENIIAKHEDTERKLHLIQSSYSDGSRLASLAENVVMLQNELTKTQAHARMLEGRIAELTRGNAGDMNVNVNMSRDMSGQLQIGEAQTFKTNMQDEALGALPQLVQNNAGTTLMSILPRPASVGALANLVPQSSNNPSVSLPVQMPVLPTGGMVALQTQTPVASAHPSTSFNDMSSLHQPIMHRTISAVSLQENQKASVSEATGGSGEAASGEPLTIVGQAQNLVRAASLHGVAKNEAATQAQKLAVEAQKHAQASVKAAQQAEELKKTLSNLPESEKISDQVQQAAATVSSLEARAQAHASITTQVVAKARDMHEIAQTHEKEEMKAMTQATMLQVQATTLQQTQTPMAIINDGSHTIFPGTAGPTVASPMLVVAPTPQATGNIDVDDESIANASDGLPNTALHLSGASANAQLSDQQQQQQIAIAQMVLQQRQAQVLNPSHIIYTNVHDPSAEATALQQQIAALHAQQPESLVSAPPIQIPDATPQVGAIQQNVQLPTTNFDFAQAMGRTDTVQDT
jgi:hypothetical protein